MVEPNRREDPPVPLTPQSSIAEIDAKLAARQAGFRTKGPPAAEVLEHAFEIRTVDDLLHHYPRRYIDRSRVATIGALKVGQPATVIATVKKAMKRLTRRHQTMVAITLYGRDRLPRAHVLQPAVDGEPVQGRHGARGERHRHAVQGQAPAREPGGRDPARRGRGDRAHRAHHARAPCERGHHDAHDPRAGVPRPRAAAGDRRSDAGRARPRRGTLATTTRRSGASTSPRTTGSSPRRSSG